MAWRKTDFPEPQAALCEAAGLRWLADVPGGARAAAVYHAEPGYLELEQIRSGPVSQQAAEHFGSALARTHAAGAAHFGQFPHDGDGFIGQAPLPAVGPRSGSPAEPESRPESRPESEPESGPRPESEPEPESEERWGPFYAEYRVLPFGRKARDHGLITSGDAALIDRLATRLANGVFEHDQPALVPVVAARLHGDLWSGNVLWDAGAEGQGVLIDPAAHGGHAESDLAMLALFGQQHLDAIIAGYGQVSPLAAGWQERIALHQVHPLLVHTVLFGGSYAEAAVAAARRYT